MRLCSGSDGHGACLHGSPRGSHVSGLHSSSWLNTAPSCHIFLIHSSVGGRLCLHILAPVKNAAVNTRVQVLPGPSVFGSLGLMLRSGVWVGSHSVFDPWRSRQTVFHGDAPSHTRSGPPRGHSACLSFPHHCPSSGEGSHLSNSSSRRLEGFHCPRQFRWKFPADGWADGRECGCGQPWTGGTPQVSS